MNMEDKIIERLGVLHTMKSKSIEEAKLCLESCDWAGVIKKTGDVMFYEIEEDSKRETLYMLRKETQCTK